jgi:hypothetical protein
MNVGDTVRHRKKGWIGKVLEVSLITPGVLVNLSDTTGVMVRSIHRDNLEVVSESR